MEEQGRQEIPFKDQKMYELFKQRNHISGTLTEILPPILHNGCIQKGGLYLSGAIAAENQQLLLQKNIKSVITVIKGAKLNIPEQIISSQITIEIDDDIDEDIAVFFNDAIKFIEDNIKLKNNVLVHCVAGVSRSATIIAAYLMKSQSICAERAIAFCKQYRKEVNPNPNFLRQLRRFENSLNLKQNEIGLVQI